MGKDIHEMHVRAWMVYDHHDNKPVALFLSESEADECASVHSEKSEGNVSCVPLYAFSKDFDDDEE